MERTISFTLNGKAATVKADDERMLLWVLRSDLGLTGTKFGCGEGLCGACTVIVEKEAVRSCVTPLKSVAGKQVMTIEGLGQSGLHSRAAGLPEPSRLPVRILHAGHDPDRLRAAAENAASHARADRAAPGGQPVPLRRARTNSGRRAGSRRNGKGGCVMSDMTTSRLVGVGGRRPVRLLPRDALARAQEPARLPGRQSGPMDLNAYLKIGADGRVTCLAGKVELGQGCHDRTGAWPWRKNWTCRSIAVDVVLGDTDLCPYDMGTFGSMTHAAADSGGAAGGSGGQGGAAANGVGAAEGAGGAVARRRRGRYRRADRTGSWWKASASSGTWPMCR